jgi:DNA-3-methyladenine glycosylase II
MATVADGVRAAEGALATADPVMARLVRDAGPCTLRRRSRGTHFEALVRAIVFQQLAGRAAEAIHGRVVALAPGGRLTPGTLAALPEPALRAAGLSGAKAASVLDLAAAALDGRVRLGRIGALPDEDVVEQLVRVRGIGRWTAEMFLIFQLGRLDVWPIGDLGVRRGYARAYGLAADPAPIELAAFGERFRPYRSVAAWYCWRVVDTLTV